jgi:hypothetical protein
VVALRAVPSCAGAYVSGAAGSNECPAGSARIETEEACRTAAAAAGKTMPMVLTIPNVPRGCFFITSTNANDAFFNAHTVGAGDRFRQLLCAAVTTGALPPHRCVLGVHRSIYTYVYRCIHRCIDTHTRICVYMFICAVGSDSGAHAVRRLLSLRGR